MDILTLTNTQAKELAGRLVTIGMETYCFQQYDPRHRGQPPWRSGAEGKAFPLLGHDREVRAYLKFFTRPTQKRLDRTAWLIAQRMHAWLPNLAAAPMVWTDTRRAAKRPEGSIDFAGYLARAVPGKTWLELKTAIADKSVLFADDARWHCACDLLLSLAALEQEGIVHGDLSPNNVVIDAAARPDQPALYLIDFDAFAADAAGENRSLSVAEGGTYGTEGYCPPDLASAAAEGRDAAPYSDRYGRDMLVLELLLMESGVSSDDPPSYWNRDEFDRRFSAWQARAAAGCSPLLSYLDPASIFSRAESERTTSAELAAALGLALAARPLRHKMTRVKSVVPAALGQSLASLPADPLSRRWAARGDAPVALHYFVPWKWSRPEADPFNRTLWQDIMAAAIVAVPLLLLLLAGILIAIFGK